MSSPQEEETLIRDPKEARSSARGPGCILRGKVVRGNGTNAGGGGCIRSRQVVVEPFLKRPLFRLQGEGEVVPETLRLQSRLSRHPGPHAAPGPTPGPTHCPGPTPGPRPLLASAGSPGSCPACGVQHLLLPPTEGAGPGSCTSASPSLTSCPEMVHTLPHTHTQSLTHMHTHIHAHTCTYSCIV